MSAADPTLCGACGKPGLELGETAHPACVPRQATAPCGWCGEEDCFNGKVSGCCGTIMGCDGLCRCDAADYD